MNMSRMEFDLTEFHIWIKYNHNKEAWNMNLIFSNLISLLMELRLG